MKLKMKLRRVITNLKINKLKNFKNKREVIN
jgi:hypothetical protein